MIVEDKALGQFLQSEKKKANLGKDMKREHPRSCLIIAARIYLRGPPKSVLILTRCIRYEGSELSGLTFGPFFYCPAHLHAFVFVLCV